MGCHSVALQSETKNTIAPRVTLRVATSGDYTPFSRWPPHQLEPSGFSVSVAKAYAESRGAKLEWIRFRWSELSDDLESFAFDIALSGVTVRPDRSRKGRFSLPLTTSGAVALVPEESPFQTAGDLNQDGIRLAVNAGGHLERVARRLFTATTIEAISENADVLGALMKGRADVLLTDSLEAPHWQRLAHRRLRSIGPLTRDRKAAWFPAENEHEANLFNHWLLRAEASGLLARLREEFELPQKATSSPEAALLSSLDERLTLMAAVAEVKMVLGVATENIAREKSVLDAATRSVLRFAKAAGIESPNSSSIRRLFQAQIAAAKWIQNRRRDELQSGGDQTLIQTGEGARSELEQTLRPALIYLGDRISMSLVAYLDSSESTITSEKISAALARHHLPNRHLRAIYEAILEIKEAKKSTR
ncbi:MAG: transporter substrate-binding domain-containing protein [Myxococcota bacterium]